MKNKINQMDLLDRIRTDSTSSKFIIDLLWALPGRTFSVFIFLLLSGLMEGLGVASVLPLISTISQGNIGDSSIENVLNSGFAMLGMEPTLGTLLALVVIGITCKAVLTLIAMRGVGYAVAQVATDLRLSILSSLFSAKWSFFVNQPVGSFANAISGEVDKAASAYNTQLIFRCLGSGLIFWK